MNGTDMNNVRRNKEAHAIQATLSDSSRVDIVVTHGAALYTFSNPKLAVQVFNMERKNPDVGFMAPNKIGRKYPGMKALEIVAQIGKEIKKAGGKFKDAKGIIDGKDSK